MAYQSEIEKLEQRYRENPDQWFAALADSYRKAGSLDLALDVVRAGLDKRPNYVSGHIVLGRCLLQKPDDGAAAQAFEKVLSLDAENVIALKALSEVSERAGRMADAVRWLTRLLEVDPMNEEAAEALLRLKAAGAAAAPPTPAATAQTAEAAEGTPVAGLEATIAEASTVEPEPAGEFTIEKSQDATRVSQAGAVSLEALGLDAGEALVELEPMEFEPPLAGEPVAAEAGVETMAFEPPSAAETPALAPDVEPMQFTPPEPDVIASAPAEIPVQPFDDQLAWGTGERLSGAISQADLEAAGQVRESTLEPAARELPGLEFAEVPPVGVEERIRGGDLPLIFPDEVPPRAEAGAREAEAPVGSVPEAVVTETMAELYAKQGLMAEARDTYRKLAALRPGDPAVASRLNELEGVVAGRRLAGGARVVESGGGPSARDFLAGVFGGTAPAPSAAPVEASTPMEAAIGGAPRGAPAPTRPASDEVSLASVFGEEPAPVRQPAAPAQPEATPAGQGFSFDEFFGGQKSSAAPGQAGEDTGAEGSDDFKRWLKGLKS